MPWISLSHITIYSTDDAPTQRSGGERRKLNAAAGGNGGLAAVAMFRAVEKMLVR